MGGPDGDPIEDKDRDVCAAVLLDDINRQLPAGAYTVETEEETLDVASFLSCRRAGTRLFIPAVAGISETEMWVVDPQALDHAIALDRTVSAATD